jgi:hypothetical protein
MNEWGDINPNWDIATQFAARTDKRGEKSGLEEIKAKQFKNYFNDTFELIKQINFKIPEINESTLILTMKSFSAVGLINYIIEEEKKYPNKMICFIYSLNSKVAERLNIIADKTETTKIVLSDLQNTAFRSKEKAVLECFKSKKIESIFVHSHAKIISLDFGLNKYTILGSGNLASNARVEQYQIINSSEMYNFIDSSFEEMKSVQVSKRNKELWHTTN